MEAQDLVDSLRPPGFKQDLDFIRAAETGA